jgi:hypothetical protein
MKMRLTFLLVVSMASGSCADYTTDNKTCTQLESDWEACGGDPIGLWEIAGFCNHGLPRNLLADECPDSSYENVVQVVGTVEIGEDWIVLGPVSRVIMDKYEISLECIAAIGMDSCRDMEEVIAADFGTSTCTGVSATCRCEFEDVTYWADEEMTFGVSGVNLVTGEGEPYAYCVRGNEMVWRGEEHEGVTAFIIFRRP